MPQSSNIFGAHYLFLHFSESNLRVRVFYEILCSTMEVLMIFSKLYYAFFLSILKENSLKFKLTCSIDQLSLDENEMPNGYRNVAAYKTEYNKTNGRNLTQHHPSFKLISELVILLICTRVFWCKWNKLYTYQYLRYEYSFGFVLISLSTLADTSTLSH